MAHKFKFQIKNEILQKHFVIYGKLRYNLMQGLHAPPFPIVSWRQSFVKPWSDSLHMNPAESITPAHWTQTNCWGNDAKDPVSVESRPELSSEESKQSGQPSSRHSFGIHYYRNKDQPRGVYID